MSFKQFHKLQIAHGSKSVYRIVNIRKTAAGSLFYPFL